MTALTIRKDPCELDFLSLGALVHRLDPGVIPFRKARSFEIWVSGGEYNVSANLSDCFGLRTGVATALVNYPLGDLNDGGRYNPSTDAWMVTTTTNAPGSRTSPSAVWTGSEMIVWGGLLDYGNAVASTGGRYCAQSGPTPTPTVTPRVTPRPRPTPHPRP